MPQPVLQRQQHLLLRHQQLARGRMRHRRRAVGRLVRQEGEEHQSTGHSSLPDLLVHVTVAGSAQSVSHRSQTRHASRILARRHHQRLASADSACEERESPLPHVLLQHAQNVLSDSAAEAEDVVGKHVNVTQIGAGAQQAEELRPERSQRLGVQIQSRLLE